MLPLTSLRSRPHARRAVRAFVVALAAWTPLWAPAPRALAASPASAGTSEIAAGIARGIDRLMNMELDRAAAEARAVQQLPGGEVAGALLAAFIPVAHLQDKEDVAADADQFLETIRPILDRVRTLEADTPRDAEVKLLAGMVWGTKAMVDGVRHNYLAATGALRETHRAFGEALVLRPDLYDAYYGLGLYDLAVGQLPRLLRAAATLVLPSGDMARGLLRLRLAAEQGTFTRSLARMVLFRHLVAEQQYAEAAALGQTLLDRYPNNPEVYFPLAFCYSETGRHDEALRVARRAGARIEAGAPPFGRELSPRYQQLMGKLYMDMGEHATALRFFRQAVEGGTKSYAWVTAWALTRSGMIHDLHGDRAEAVRLYRQALEIDTESLAKEAAREYLAHPYSGSPISRRRVGS